MYDSVLTDLRYAMVQLRIVTGRPCTSVEGMIARDCAERALDGLERVECELLALAVGDDERLTAELVGG